MIARDETLVFLTTKGCGPCQVEEAAWKAYRARHTEAPFIAVEVGSNSETIYDTLGPGLVAAVGLTMEEARRFGIGRVPVSLRLDGKGYVLEVVKSPDLL